MLGFARRRATLTGRVVRLGDVLSISVELVDVEGNTIWGERYRKNFSEIFAVQEDMAKQISERTRLRLTRDDQQRLAKRSTQNTEAYHLYLRGRYYWNKRTEDALKKAIEYFNQAIEN